MPAPRLIVLAVAAVLAGCATGQRPSFDDDEPPSASTGDANVDAVLQRLDSVRIARFTAEYDVLTRFGSIESEAVVVQSDRGRRSITINDIRFVIGNGTDATCDLAVAECEATINDASVADLQLTHEFYAPSFARRLRVDADRRLGDTTGYTRTMAGQVATCVDVPLSGNVVRSYCALDAGPLAHYNGNDLLIEITSISETPDENLFETG